MEDLRRLRRWSRDYLRELPKKGGRWRSPGKRKRAARHRNAHANGAHSIESNSTSRSASSPQRSQSPDATPRAQPQLPNGHISECNVMEGQLSKWTNMMHGWQYRYVVLNDDSLCYFTSRDKMIRGQQRGCISLVGAMVGIEGDSKASFTITVDGKVFHFQGKDDRERDQWVRALERIIHATSGYYKPQPNDQVTELQSRTRLAEKQLKDLLEITRKLELVDTSSEKGKEKKARYLNEIILTTRRLQSTVEHSAIILRQVQAKFPQPAGAGEPESITEAADTVSPQPPTQGEPMYAVENVIKSPKRSIHQLQLHHTPHITYSSSDDDEFFDATSALENDSDASSLLTDEGDGGHTAESGESAASGAERRHKNRHRPHRRNSHRASERSGDTEMSPRTGAEDADATHTGETHHHRHHGHHGHHGHRRQGSHGAATSGPPTVASIDDEPDWGDADENFDRIYDNPDDSDVGDVRSQHGSVITHLLSQVSIGMDLTRVTLPTFILERRSLLEMYADFFAHPEEFIHANGVASAEERFISVVRYYLCAFYPARKSGVAKKPYNPVLGETFRCRWTVPGTTPSAERTTSGPFPGSATNQVTFIAEQVSHHPPISAFYAECPSGRISLRAHIWTKSSFLGLSIGVANIGRAVLTLHDYDEEYIVTFPDGYGRSILTTPWVELGGKVEVRCEKTGYRAEIEFLTKPFIGGKAHRIAGNIYRNAIRRPLLTLEGEWNGIIHSRLPTGEKQLFADVRAKPDVRKECQPVNEQTDRESRRLWRHVTTALFHNRIETASEAKRWIEERQRAEVRQRTAHGVQHEPEFFRRLDSLDNKQTSGWEFVNGLSSRASD